MMRSIPATVRAPGASEQAIFEMAKNPWISLWLSAANTWAGAAQSFWAAEMHRQQKAILNEVTKPKARHVTKGSFKKVSAGVLLPMRN